jgi:hypothetical protein
MPWHTGVIALFVRRKFYKLFLLVGSIIAFGGIICFLLYPVYKNSKAPISPKPDNSNLHPKYESLPNILAPGNSLLKNQEATLPFKKPETPLIQPLHNGLLPWQVKEIPSNGSLEELLRPGPPEEEKSLIPTHAEEAEMLTSGSLEELLRPKPPEEEESLIPNLPEEEESLIPSPPEEDESLTPATPL